MAPLDGRPFYLGDALAISTLLSMSVRYLPFMGVPYFALYFAFACLGFSWA